MHVLISALHRPCKPTGVCRHAANLARCLAASPEITQVTIAIGTWQLDYFTTVFDLRSPKISVTCVDIPNTSISRNRWFLWELPKLARQLRPDLVHLSFPLPFDRWRFPCPVISTIHDLYPYECPENFGIIQAYFNRFFLRMCVQQSDGIACVSQTTLNKLKFFFPENLNYQNAILIYNIVDFNHVEPKIPSFFEATENIPFLLNVGQHRTNKNIKLLIDSYALLLKTQKIDASINLIIVGSDGPETAYLQQQIQELKLESKVDLVRSINDNELYWLYKHCKAVVLPSSIEGFCLPLAEAVHLSCPVVCSDIPIFREIGSSDCIYFDLLTDPIENLSTAILKVIQQPLSVRDNKPSQFSRSVISRQYLKFYSDILNTSK
jgi:glycosyltransferase involved in cell wall biosynthesis